MGMLRKAKFERAELRAAGERMASQHVRDCMQNQHEEAKLENARFIEGKNSIAVRVNKNAVNTEFQDGGAVNTELQDGGFRRRGRRANSERFPAAMDSCLREGEGELELFRPMEPSEPASTYSDLRGSLTKAIFNFGSDVLARCHEWRQAAGDSGDDRVKSEECFRSAHETLRDLGMNLESGEHVSVASMGAKSNAAEALAICLEHSGTAEDSCLELAKREYLVMSDSEDMWTAELDLIKKLAASKREGIPSKVIVDLREVTTQLAFAKKPGEECPTEKAGETAEAIRASIRDLIGSSYPTVVVFVGKSTDGNKSMLTLKTECADGNADNVAKKISSKSSYGGGRSRRRRLSDYLEVDMASSATVREMPEDEQTEDGVASSGSSSGSSYSGNYSYDFGEWFEGLDELSGGAHVGMPIVSGSVAALCLVITLFA